MIESIKDGSLLRLKTGKWTHFSKRGHTVILTTFDEYERKKFTASSPELRKILEDCKPFSIEEVTARTLPTLLFPASKLSAQEPSVAARWLLVIDCLRHSLETTTQTIGNLKDRPKPPIPQTRLRRFYETLRLFSSEEVHSAFAADGKRAGTILKVLFEESLTHFSRYENDEPFHRRKRGAWIKDEYGRKPESFARCLQARLNPLPNSRVWEVGGNSSLNFRTLDYEISPMRTTDAEFEDGSSGKSSGGGGLDLLLCRDEGRIPVIGEIKAETDTNIFLALVQALVYASELVTPTQLARLHKHYDIFREASKPPGHCEMYLIFQKRGNSDAPRLLNEAIEIARAIVSPSSSSAIRDRVKRIAFLSAELGGDKAVSFEYHDQAV